MGIARASRKLSGIRGVNGIRGVTGLAGGAAGGGIKGSIKNLDIKGGIKNVNIKGSSGAGGVKSADDVAGGATKGAAGAGAAGTGAAGSAAKGVDDAAAAATKKKKYLDAVNSKKLKKLGKGAAVVGGLAYASYQSIKTGMKMQEEVDELVAECLLSCLPQHPNIEKPEAPAICLSEDNYNNVALKEWYFPSKNELNGPDCEENSALCKKPRDCTANDVRSICKANSLDTYNRCSEDCEAKCRRCIPNPTALQAVISTAVEGVDTVAGGVGEALGSVAGALGVSPTMILAVGLLLIFFLFFK